MRTARGNPWAVLTVLSCGFFMTLLDATIVNVAVPSMIDGLHASFGEILWAVNGYLLVLAALLITGGRLGDLYGPRRVFAAGVALFTLASLACALADGPGALVAARGVQGLGAALLVPQTMTLIVGVFPARRRGAALGVWGAVAGVAAVTGPALGGLVVSGPGWRWIFLVNVPVGAAVLAAVFLVVPDLRPGNARRLDLTGVLLASTAVFCLVFALTEGERYEWGGVVPVLFAAALVLGAAFAGQQRRRQGRDPLVPFELFRDRPYTVMNFVAASVAAGVLGLLLVASLYFQDVLRFGALKTGLVLAPASVVSTALAPFAGRLTDRTDGTRVLLAGMVLTAAGMTWTALVMGPRTEWSAFVAPMAVIGAGNGCVVAPMTAVAMRGIAAAVAGAASGVLNTVRQLGSVVGSAAVGAFVQAQSAAGHDGLSVMRTAMALPIGAVVLGAAACAAVVRADAGRTC